MPPGERAYTRLSVDERRRRLLELGRRLFTRHPYDELSMAAIAREAGISKALLYHYFPSKQAFFVATLDEAARDLAERIRPDPSRRPGEQLASAVDAWLDWVEANRDAYGKLVRGATAVPEVRELVDRVREDTTSLVLERLWGGQPAPPEVRTAVRAWLWFVDGALMDWVERGEPSRERLHALLVGALPAVVAAAGHADVVDRL